MIVACVLTGTEKYSIRDVARLRDMVRAFMPGAYRFVCLTDNRDAALDGVEFVQNVGGLPGWWAKMALFAHDWRAGDRVVYFDLDTLIVKSLAPMLDIDPYFGICENFTRLSGNLNWPCRYGSCVMMIGRNLSNYVWLKFLSRRQVLMRAHARYGDQRVIEDLIPKVTLLQSVLPERFMIGYRDLRETPDERVAVINFGGRHKADNSTFKWVRDLWAA